jgi:hypothetical protein
MSFSVCFLDDVHIFKKSGCHAISSRNYGLWTHSCGRFCFTNLKVYSHLITFGHRGSFLQILRKCGGSLELVDVSCELPQLVRRPGLKSWKVSSWRIDSGFAILFYFIFYYYFLIKSVTLGYV